MELCEHSLYAELVSFLRNSTLLSFIVVACGLSSSILCFSWYLQAGDSLYQLSMDFSIVHFHPFLRRTERLSNMLKCRDDASREG